MNNPSEEWILPLSSRKRWTLTKALATMSEFKLQQGDVPLIIKLVENPKYDIGLFAGNVSLNSHDCIHVLLGRGLLPKDEAFVIGYTMGSTNKMWRWRRNLFMFCAKYLYPKGYKFGEGERLIFNMGVALGALCKADLSKFNFSDKKIRENSLTELRKKLGIDKSLLKHYYTIEKSIFPRSKESQRLV